MRIVKNIRHSGIVVSDITKSVHFYTALGFKIVASGELSANQSVELLQLYLGDLQYVKLGLTARGPLIELYYFLNAYVREQYITNFAEAYNHLAFTVRDAERLYLTLQENGINCLSAPRKDSEGKHLLFFARDPDGNLLEMVEELKCKK